MRVEYQEDALHHLENLSPAIQKRITDKIDFYAAQPNPLSFAKRLVGYDAYRYRIGDYRAIFEIDSGTMYVLLIVKREGAYRDL